MEDSYHESPRSSDCPEALAASIADELRDTPEPNSSGIAIARIRVGLGAHDLLETGYSSQRDLFGGMAGDSDRIGEALDAVRDRFGDHVVLRGGAFRSGPVRQEPSKVD